MQHCAHIAALAMTVIMILHVRGKFTAVGKYRSYRSEIIAALNLDLSNVVD